MAVKVLDIDADLAGVKAKKIKSRVALIGVELEGGWTELPRGGQLERDGSVQFANRNQTIRHIGEVALGPVPPAAMPGLLAENYPPNVNKTCGMHVHMSFHRLSHYQLLMVPEYQETMCEYLIRWAKDAKFRPAHCIWERLEGKSQYCLKEFWPDLQAQTKEKSHRRERPGHRYTVIHYCGRQNTIECRVLPMMRSHVVAAKAIQQVVDITDACINYLGKRAERRENGLVSASANNMSYVEEVTEVI